MSWWGDKADFEKKVCPKCGEEYYVRIDYDRVEGVGTVGYKNDSHKCRVADREILIEKGSKGRMGHSKLLFNYEEGIIEENEGD